MSVGTEFREVERPVVEWAKKNEWYTLKINVQGKIGFPDHFFFGAPRCLVMMEFKAPGKQLKPIQAYVHKKLAALGWPVHVITSKESGINVLIAERARAVDSQTVSGTCPEFDDVSSIGGADTGPRIGED